MSSHLKLFPSLALAALLACAVNLPANAQIVEGMPDAIVCSVEDPTGVLPWAQMVFYVSARTRDGRTLYKSATSDPVVLLVSPEGVVSGANLADCDGRSVESLRKARQAFTYAHHK